MSMMTHRLQQHARRILSHSNRTRLLCSYTNGTLSSISPATNFTLRSRIEAALDEKSEISTVLEQWRQHQGNRLNPSLVRGIVENLRDSKRFGHALEISDWMIKQKICSLVPEDFAARFHLIENVLGLDEAELFFESIPEDLRGQSIYTVLLDSYARRKALDKAESTFKKMRELGLLLRASPYNSMTSLYSSLGKREKVDEILLEMKESNIELDSLSVNNALRVYAAVSDVETMEKFLADWEATATIEWLTTLDMAKAYLRAGSNQKASMMLQRTERLKDPESYQELMRTYGDAGSKKDVYRTWDLYKNTRKKDNEGFRALIGSLLKLNDIKGAEKIYYKDWECSGLEFDVRIPTMLASAYHANGMVNMAYKLMNKTVRKREFDRPLTPLLEKWGNKVKTSDLRDLIKNLRDSNQFSKALEASSWMAEKTGNINLFPEDYAARLYLIESVLGLEEAEKFFKKSIPEEMKDQAVYTTLLGSYSRSEKTLHKAEATFEKMRDLGFLSKLSPFNSMISLYGKLGRLSDVENILCKMKEKNIEPDSLTVNNVLWVCAETDIETMEKYKRELVDADKKIKLELRTMIAMGKAYEKAGQIPKAIEITESKEEVHRLWNVYKKKEKEEIGSEGYRSVISSLLKLDDVKGAEEMYGEWEQQGAEFDSRIPCMLISRYCEEDDEVKVKELMNSSRKSWNRMKFTPGQ